MLTRPPEFSFRTRARNLQALSRETFDVLVIGGGITGAGVARDAALRGLSVALVERKDFAAGTSSRSSKLIHGGLRYLEQGDISLVREASTERYAIRRLVPYLARPTKLLVPVAGRSGYAKIKLGLWTFDRIAGVPDHERYRMLGKEEAIKLEPLLRADRIYGAGLYYEYLTDDARLVTEVTKSAAALGAVIANYAEATGFVIENGRVGGATVRDSLGGGEMTVRARTVINAAGPWVDNVRLLCGQGEKPRLQLTKGIHVAIPREKLPISSILIMSARDRRSVFAIPQGDVTYVGTTDTFYDAPADYPDITAEDVDYLLDAVHRTFTVESLSASDVVSAWAGLRPLLAEEGKSPSEISRKDEVMVSDTGLLSIAGGKLTTFRRMAERIVDMACGLLKEQGRFPPEKRGESDEAPLSGGDTGDDTEAYAAQLKNRWATVDPAVVDRLVKFYGSNAQRMVEAIGADPALGVRLAPRLPVTRAEVEYAVREEMAMTIEDFFERRSRLLLWDPRNGLDAVEPVARSMGALLGWSEQRTAAEIAAYIRLTARLKSFATPERPTTGSKVIQVHAV